MFTRKSISGHICFRAISFAPFMLLVLQTSCLWAQQLTPAQVQSDLVEFRADLEDRFSYFWYNQATNGYSAALESIQAKADANNGMSTNDFRKELHKIIALFIDGHAKVKFDKTPSGELPFRFWDAKDGVVALLSMNSGYYDADYPYITKIDGEDLDVWIDRAKNFVSKSSRQRVRRKAMKDFLTYINMVRHEFGFQTSGSVMLEFKSLSGATKQVTINLGRSPSLGDWPETVSGLLSDQRIGYLRLPSFSGNSNEDGTGEIKEWMPRFKQTAGLIIDIRENGGGHRDALRVLLPYFMNDRDAPHIVNVGKYRLYSGFSIYQLASRFLYRIDNLYQFDSADVQAIKDFKETFKPEWDAPADKFSDWHYMVINKKTNPQADFFYDKQVVVLTDGGVFSAADIFAGGLKGWRNVTFMGTPTGGGSASSETEELSITGTDVKLGSMISFQNNGMLYDRNGVAVDVLVEPIPSDLIVGGTDTQLDSAIAYILSNVANQYRLKPEIIGNGTINMDSFGGWYDSLDVATITAIPAPGWVFDGWGGDATGSENPLTITMNGDKNIIATFSAGPKVIYYTGFESGVLDTIAWTTQSSAAEGRIQVTTAYGPRNGNYHLTMDTEVETRNKVTNEAWLHLDLSGKSQVNLNFWWHDYNDGNDEFIDGIFFSDDGGATFEQVLSLIDGTIDYQEINLDVDSLASANSLNLTNEFIVKFQQHEDNPIPLRDGFGFDDINVIAETLDDINENKTGEKVRQYVLHQNYPNPFNPKTKIKFDLPENGMVKLNIYNILGQKVLELVNRELNSGQYNYSFDAGNLPSGVYVYKLETKNYNQTRKMILMK